MYVNFVHLGQKWPLVGPQITFYVPKDNLLRQRNTIVDVATEIVSINNVIRFTGSSIFPVDGAIVYECMTTSVY